MHFYRAMLSGGIWIASPLFLVVHSQLTLSKCCCFLGLTAPIVAFWIIIRSLCSSASIFDMYCNRWVSHSTSSYDVPNYKIAANSCAVGGNSANLSTLFEVIEDDFPFFRWSVSSGLICASCSGVCVGGGASCCYLTCAASSRLVCLLLLVETADSCASFIMYMVLGFRSLQMGYEGQVRTGWRMPGENLSPDKETNL